MLSVPPVGGTLPADTVTHPAEPIATKESLLLDLPRPAPVSVEEVESRVPPDGKVQEPADEDRMDSAEEPAGWADPLLYPANLDGLVQIGILAVALWAVGLFGFFIVAVLGLYSGVLVLILRVIVIGYAAFYLSYCIFDSSRGGRRAATVSLAHTPDLRDLLSQLLLLLGSVAICFSPAAGYYVATERADVWFWGLGISGAFFFPMALLTATLFDGIDALNPILIVKSIIMTLPAYLVLTVQLGVTAFLLMGARYISWRLPIPQLLWNAVGLYLLLIGAHLLGRFYYRRRDALDWGL